jgi:hypothetical protein
MSRKKEEGGGADDSEMAAIVTCKCMCLVFFPGNTRSPETTKSNRQQETYLRSQYIGTRFVLRGFDGITSFGIALSKNYDLQSRVGGIRQRCRKRWEFFDGRQ